MIFKVNKISITGFKGYKGTVEYNFKNKNFVKGGNGLGKSSIGEAIAWAITGCDIWGNERATKDLVNDQKPKITEVVLDFTLDEVENSIVRRKKGATNEVYWNEKKCTTNDISKEIFKGKDIFFSIFNPYYFPQMAPKDAKALLSNALVPVKKEDIFEELGEYLTKILKDNGFRMPETFMSDTRANIKEHEENIIYLEGTLDGLKTADILEKKEFNDTELKELKERLLSFGNNAEEEKALNELKVEEVMLKAEINNISLQEEIPVADKKSRKDYLLQKYKEKKNKLDSFKSKIVTCEKCGNNIDLTKEAKEVLNNEIQEILVKGKKLKAEIDEIEKKNVEIRKKNQEVKESKEKEVSEKMNVVTKKKEDINKRLQEREKLENESIEPIKDRIAELEVEEREVIERNASIDAAISHNEKLEKERKITLERIENSKKKIDQLKLALDAGKQYNSIKIKKQSSQINKYLNRVSIQFEKMTKDGEVKDDFKILFDGRDFNRVSASQQVIASLEIANLLMNVQNLFFPIFLDDGEKINNIPEMQTQMIVAKVTKDNEIKMEVEE